MWAVAQYAHEHNEKEFVFSNVGKCILDDFCEWLFNESRHKGYRCIFHNGKGYDAQFVLNWLYNNADEKEIKVIQN